MALAGFALPMYPEFEPSRVRLSPPRYLTCLLGLQDVSVGPGISSSVRKLVCSPRVIKKNLLRYYINN
jgi:hypothetical protein